MEETIRTTASPPVKVAEPKHLQAWGPVAAIGWAITVYLLPQVGVGLLLAIYPAIRHWSNVRANNWLTNSIPAQFIYTLLVEVTAVALVWRLLKHYSGTFRLIGLKRAKGVDSLYALVGFGVYMIIYVLAAAVAAKTIPGLNVSQQQAVGFQHATSVSALIMTFLSLVLLPPFAEEIIFRGFVFTGFRRKFGFVLSALFTSLLFAAPHLLESSGGGLLWVAGIDTFILSLVLCNLREKTDRLWAGMGVHALKNAVAFASIFIFHAR